MDYLKFDLGVLKCDRVVEITLTKTAANVHLLDSSNFFNYVRGRDFHGLGGLTWYSPVTFTIPNQDHWYVVVDMKGFKGKPEASVRLR